jgi:hypothetical protein
MKRFLISSAAIAMLATSMLTSVAYADADRSVYFTDMNSQSYGFWAIDEVDTLFQKGVVHGVGDNKFAPENLMERGDFVLMLNNAFSYPEISTKMYNFYDVPQDSYYFTAINNARGNGITDDSAVFEPENAITRIAAFKMLYRTMNLYGCVGSNGSTDTSMYTDGNLLLNTEDKIAVGTLTKLGIISGSNGEIKPNDTVTRAEMAVMIAKAVEVYEANGSKDATTNTKQELKPVLSGAEANPDESRVTSSAEKITETVTVEDGDSETIDGNEIAVESGNGVVVTGDGSKLVINDSQASTRGTGTTVISVEDGAEAELNGMSINASANDSTGVYVDADSELTMKSCKVYARSTKSGVVVKGDTEIDDSTISASNTDALTIYGGTTVDITGTSFTSEGSNSCIRIKGGSGNYDTVTLNLTDVDFSGNKKGSAIIVENAKVVINVKDVTLNGLENFITTTYNYTSGMKDTDIEINLDGQTLEGKINADDKTNLELNLKNGSTFTGSLNYANSAKTVDVYISEDSLLELTDDCYVDSFVIEECQDRNDRNFGTFVKDNGSSIYYDDENHDNDYLSEDSYSLRNGGQLTPKS